MSTLSMNKKRATHWSLRMLWWLVRAYVGLVGVFWFSLTVIRLTNSPSHWSPRISSVGDWLLSALYGLCVGLVLLLPPRLLVRKKPLTTVLYLVVVVGIAVGLWTLPRTPRSLDDWALATLVLFAPAAVAVGRLFAEARRAQA